jgi:hypothetical protein
MPFSVAMDTARNNEQTAQSNAGWLSFTIRVQDYQRAREQAGALDGGHRPAAISGGADADDELRRSVRKRLADGRLMRASSVSVSRRGSGGPCVVCSRVIENTEVEREVEEREGRAVAHDRCYLLWREESRYAARVQSHATIRDKLSAGVLPKTQCRMTWYGPGRGVRCMACEETIRPDQTEVECDLPDGGATVVLHQECYEVWAAMARGDAPA